MQDFMQEPFTTIFVWLNAQNTFHINTEDASKIRLDYSIDPNGVVDLAAWHPGPQYGGRPVLLAGFGPCRNNPWYDRPQALQVWSASRSKGNGWGKTEGAALRLVPDGEGTALVYQPSVDIHVHVVKFDVRFSEIVNLRIAAS